LAGIGRFYSSASDAFGAFTFDAVPPGETTLRLSDSVALSAGDVVLQFAAVTPVTP
jgi:hypothetical protein